MFLPRAATLKKWLFVVFRLDSKDTKETHTCNVNLGDLVKKLSKEYLVEKIGFDTAEIQPFQVGENL